MSRNLAHISSQAFNEPLLLEPVYARTFFSALGKEVGAESIEIPQENRILSAEEMEEATASFSAGNGARVAKPYRVDNGIAVVPVTGTLVHKLGSMRPYSGMTGYDGITRNLQMATDDPEVRGILLDIDSPGGQVAGAFDCADMIHRLGQKKPVWALASDMACSAAMLIASACSHRLVTQTGRMGSIGVLMAHSDNSGALEKIGVDITLIFSGNHKVDGNPYEKLPDAVRADFQKKMDETRKMFAGKVAGYMGLSLAHVMGTEAAVFDGKGAVAARLADEVVNSADALALMANKVNGGVTVTTGTDERARISAIMRSEEAKGREAIAEVLAFDTDLPADTVLAVLGKIELSTTLIAPDDDVRTQILASPEAEQREALANALSVEPGMTLARAEALLKVAAKENAAASAWSSYLKTYNTSAVSAEPGDDSSYYADGSRDSGMNAQRAIAALHRAEPDPERDDL